MNALFLDIYASATPRACNRVGSREPCRHRSESAAGGLTARSLTPRLGCKGGYRGEPRRGVEGILSPPDAGAMKKSLRRKAPHQRTRQRFRTRSGACEAAVLLHGYLARLMTAYGRAGTPFASGTLTTVNVLHAPNCPRPFSEVCTCTPELIVQTEDGKVHAIDVDGRVLASTRPS